MDIVRSEFELSGVEWSQVDWADDSLAPEYETAAVTLKNKGNIKLAKVSAYSLILPFPPNHLTHESLCLHVRPFPPERKTADT